MPVATQQQRVTKAFRNEPYQMTYCRVYLSPKLSPMAQDEEATAVGCSAENSVLASQQQQPSTVSPVLIAAARTSSDISDGNNNNNNNNNNSVKLTPTNNKANNSNNNNSSSSGSASDDEALNRSDSGSASTLMLTPTSKQEQLEFPTAAAPALSAAVAAGDQSAAQQDEQPSPTIRAPCRTMQHLLQNVPYLFLETASEATAATQERSATHSHFRTRVGDAVSTWSCPAAAASAAFASSGSSQLKDLFVAQLPFDMPLSALQELADLLLPGLGVQIVHAAPHYRKGKGNHSSGGGGTPTYDGCAFVKMTEAHATLFIETFHKRVLFDVDGVWVASTPTQTKELTDYCSWMQEQSAEQRRKILPMPTPFSAMTAEVALRAGKQNGNNNAYYNPQQQQHQQYYPYAHQHHHHAQQQYSSSYSAGFHQQQQQQQHMSLMPPMMPYSPPVSYSHGYQQQQEQQQQQQGAYSNSSYGY